MANTVLWSIYAFGCVLLFWYSYCSERVYRQRMRILNLQDQFIKALGSLSSHPDEWEECMAVLKTLQKEWKEEAPSRLKHLWMLMTFRDPLPLYGIVTQDELKRQA